MAEIEHALHEKVIDLHTKIKYRWIGVDEKGKPVRQWFDTTPGRVMLGQVLPRSTKIPYDVVNKLMTKREISSMIDQVYRHCGQKETVIFCDRIMALGFHHAFKAGISFGKDDMVVPSTKWKIIEQTRTLAKEFEQQYNDGLITQGEKYNKVVDAWSKCTEQIADEMMRQISSVERIEGGREAQVNSIYMMAHSGARGSPAQMRQLAGMRGLMAKPSGEIIETPIISNFKEGLSVLEYFNSTHGARKGLADTALKTANSGYLTRRLVDVAQDCIITTEDCGTSAGIKVRAIIDAGTVVASLAEPHPRPHHGRGRARSVIAQGGRQEGNPARRAGGRSDRQRGRAGAAHPFGAHLRDHQRACAASATGAISPAARRSTWARRWASSPRSRSASRAPSSPCARSTSAAPPRSRSSRSSSSNFDGKIKIKNKNIVKNSDGQNVAMVRNMVVAVLDPDGTERAMHRIQYGARVLVDDGDKIKRGQRIAEWDPYTRPILTEVEGTVGFEDLVEGQSMSETLDEFDRHCQARGHRLAHHPRGGPASGHRDQGQAEQGPQARPRRRGALPARRRRHHLGRSGSAREGGRRHRAHSDRERQDPRHHRRSAAGGGAVRGAAAEGGRDHRGDLRHHPLRQGLQEQAPRHHRVRRQGRGAQGVPDPEGQAHPPAGRRRGREGRLHRRRQPGAARHPGDQGRRGARRLPGQ